MSARDDVNYSLVMKPLNVAIVAAALLLLSLVAFSQERKPSPALASLVETERAFARMSIERGVRESFLAYFAEDGINFQPTPVKTRAAILSRPAPAVRPHVTLNWFPIFGDASVAGDLGFTTGPYILTDDTKKEPPDYGCYFSVWRTQPDGAWKVVLDLGIPTPALDVSPQATSTFTPAKQTAWKSSRAKVDTAGALAELRATERDFSMLSVRDGAARAFASYLIDDARFYRSGALPVSGASAIKDYLRQNVSKFSWEVIDAGVATSTDFGYTYGSYELIPAVGKVSGKTEKGYFARVWKRDARGRWRAVMNVAHALPPEQK
jgi:ketosteroid isomerase-like protein